MDSPIELPNGQLVCGRHGLVICGYCTVDYSFMADDLADSEEAMERETEALYQELNKESRDLIDARWGPPPNRPKMTKGTGRVFPTKFTLPSQPNPSSSSTPASPATLFPVSINRCSHPAARFINRADQRQVLIYTDGACLNNGQPNPRAGWAFVYGPGESIVSGRLETKGPFGGSEQGQTSNRAELRAVIAALRFRHWSGEGSDTMVIATDSEYVVEGATGWARGWVRNGWRTGVGGAVKNRDLWELLLGEVEWHYDQGLRVEFWRIGRGLNDVADAAAKKAARDREARDEFVDVMGVGV